MRADGAPKSYGNHKESNPVKAKTKNRKKNINPERCEINVRQTNPMKLRKTCQAHLIISRAQLRESQKLKICPKNKNTSGPRGYKNCK